MVSGEWRTRLVRWFRIDRSDGQDECIEGTEVYWAIYFRSFPEVISISKTRIITKCRIYIYFFHQQLYQIHEHFPPGTLQIYVLRSCHSMAIRVRKLKSQSSARLNV